MCNGVLWLNALDFPPDMAASSSDAADRLRSLDGAFHTSINVKRRSFLHVWRTVVWSGNIVDRLSKDNTFHTCYICTVTFLVVFCFQFYEASALIRATSGQVNVGILNYIHQRTHTIRLQTVHKFQEILRVSAPTRHHQGVSNIKEYQHHTSGKNNDNFFF
jgi:hypothetical protein